MKHVVREYAVSSLLPMVVCEGVVNHCAHIIVWRTLWKLYRLCKWVYHATVPAGSYVYGARRI